jgi:hypothetical protein
MIRRFMCRHTVIHKRSLWSEGGLRRAQSGIFRNSRGFSPKWAPLFVVGSCIIRRAAGFSAAMAPQIDPVVSGTTIMAASWGARTLFSVGATESPGQNALD